MTGGGRERCAEGERGVWCKDEWEQKKKEYLDSCPILISMLRFLKAFSICFV